METKNSSVSETFLIPEVKPRLDNIPLGVMMTKLSPVLIRIDLG
jgi:hypothetical protein